MLDHSAGTFRLCCAELAKVWGQAVEPKQSSCAGEPHLHTSLAVQAAYAVRKLPWKAQLLLAGDKLDVVDDQDVGCPVDFGKIGYLLVAQSAHEFLQELLT